jgi:hypothetical protein
MFVYTKSQIEGYENLATPKKNSMDKKVAEGVLLTPLKEFITRQGEVLRNENQIWFPYYFERLIFSTPL